MRALFALFVRSIREDTRARLPVILRSMLVLIILLLLWANQSDFARHAAPGRELLGMTLFANVAFLAIATVGSFASAITEEKEDGTLTLLRMTNLSALAILFGKGTSRLVGALLLLAAQVPFTLLAVTLGGVSRGQVLGAYAILGAATFFLCNLALLCSVVCRTTTRAGVWTGAMCGLLFAVLPYVLSQTILWRTNFPNPNPQTIAEQIGVWIVEANPGYALITLIEDRSAGRLIAENVALTLIAGTVCFLLSWFVFDRFCATAGEGIGLRRRRSSANRLLRGRPSVRRPLAWKDFHFLIGGWRGFGIRTLLCGLAFLGICVWARLERGEENGSPFSSLYFWRDVGSATMFVASIGFALELALVASNIFGDERRKLTLGGLAGVPRTTGWLIRQKVLGCVPVLIPSLAIFALGFLLVAASSPEPYGPLSFGDRDVVVLLYFSAQLLLLPVLVADLSLRIRRGAMPAGIAILAAGNILTVVLMIAVGGSNELDMLLFAAFAAFVIAIVLAAAVYRRIPRAAAAE